MRACQAALRTVFGAAIAIALVACDGGSNAGDAGPTTSATTSQTTLADASTTTTTGPVVTTTTTVAPPAAVLTLGEPGADGSVPVTIDVTALEPLFFGFNDNGGDPLWQIHTTQPDLFLNVELYTVYGPGWTGQTGTFATDCTANGICVSLDTDGAGPTQPTARGADRNDHHRPPRQCGLRRHAR